MLSMADFFWPIIATVMLVAIHSYLGIHVIKRQVIFVDLALAQIASLGAIYGIFLGFSIEENGFLLKLISAIFTILGSIGFALSKKLNTKVPHEALIGIFYAFSLSLIFILSIDLPHGAEEIRQMFSGSILWVLPKELFWSGILYLIVGIFHYYFRDNFFSLIKDSNNIKFSSKQRTFWDFLFYASLGLVVTSSVSMAGVLLVFSYLVIPASIGMLLSESFLKRLILGFLFGIFSSFVGLFLSFFLDWPTGPAIIIVLSSCLLLVIFIRNIFYLLLSMIIIGLLLYAPIKIIKSHDNSHEIENVIDINSTTVSQDIINILKHDIKITSQDIENLKVLSQKINDDFLKLDIAEILLKNKDSYGMIIINKIYYDTNDAFIKQEIEEKWQKYSNMKKKP